MRPEFRVIKLLLGLEFYP